MSKVLLINTNTEKSPYPVAPLGLCLLATALAPHFDVKIYDGVFDEGRSLAALVNEFKPDYIGVSIRNIDDVVADRHIYYIPDIVRSFIAPLRLLSTAPVIVGGSGFSMFPNELMEMTGADYGIIGEGEHLLTELLMALERGEEPLSDQHLLLKSSDKGKKNSSFSNTYGKNGFSEIDKRIDFDLYRQKGSYSIQTKRGCSKKCIYCTYPVIEGKSYRRRDPSEIADEIEQVYQRLGSVSIEFVDSTFNDPPGHAESICREIIKRKVKVRLRTMGINPGNASEELFGLMLEAGFSQIDATPDSASEAMLSSMGKGFRLKDVERMASLIRKFDIPTMWFFLFSGPGENEQTFSETFRFIDHHVNPNDLVYLNAGLRIYPGTPLYSIALKEGRFPANQSLLYPPVFYYSTEMGKEKVDEMIREMASTRPNCLASNDTKPSPEMVANAMELRAKEQLTEPMFRTFLRIRRQNWG
jgi:radical SAM superfamily enzyme YgiQ (UPF0313 family)